MLNKKPIDIININRNFIKRGRIIILLLLFIFNPHKKDIIKNISKYQYDLIIPIGPSDIKVFLAHLEYYKKYLNYSNIVVITSSDIIKLLKNETTILYIDEDTLIPKDGINKVLKEKKFITTIRDNWYKQQFLKMAYAKIGKKEYYLIWDVDTIPIRYNTMFEKNHPFFDMKYEHHIPYFNTLDRLIPGLKYSNSSYISEHMMIKKELMNKLLDCIEINSNI